MIANPTNISFLRANLSHLKEKACALFDETVELVVSVKRMGCLRPIRCSAVILGDLPNFNQSTNATSTSRFGTANQLKTCESKRIALGVNFVVLPKIGQTGQAADEHPAGQRSATKQDRRSTNQLSLQPDVQPTENPNLLLRSQEHARPKNKDRQVWFTLRTCRVTAIDIGKISTSTTTLVANVVNVLSQIRSASPGDISYKSLVNTIHLRCTMSSSINITKLTFPSK